MTAPTGAERPVGRVPYYADDWLRVYQGDCREVMASMEAGSVHCVVTSPPYWGLRDYGIEPTIWDGDLRCARRDRSPHHEWQDDGRCANEGCDSWRGALGSEPSPSLYVRNIVQVLDEARRVLRADGTLWLNLGDTYAAQKGASMMPAETLAGGKGGVGGPQAHRGRARESHGQAHRDAASYGLKNKDRVMIPARVALALQADGWWLRDEIVWSKPNPMPSSVADRTTPSHEMVYLLAKSARYYYDGEAIKEPMAESSIQRINQPTFDSQMGGPKDYANGTNPNQSARKALENVAKRRKPAGWNVDHVESNLIGRYSHGKQAEIAANSNPATARTMGGFNDRWDESERRNPTWAERKAAGAHAGGHGGGNLEGTGTQRGVHGDGLSHDLGDGMVRNKRSVWTIPSQAYPEAHFATFPEALIEPMIRAGCPSGGTVLDPFAGSGTTGRVAQRLSRKAVLIDLNADYLVQAMRRNQDIPLGLETA